MTKYPNSSFDAEEWVNTVISAFILIHLRELTPVEYIEALSAIVDWAKAELEVACTEN